MDDAGLADDYTPAQRRAIDADIAASMEDFKQCRFDGPFPTAKEASRQIEQVAKKRATTKKVRRPLLDEGRLVAWRIESDRRCARASPQSFYFTIEGDAYRIHKVTSHPK